MKYIIKDKTIELKFEYENYDDIGLMVKIYSMLQLKNLKCELIDNEDYHIVKISFLDENKKTKFVEKLDEILVEWNKNGL